MARYDENNNPYSWMPGFLRRFLNLSYDEPQGAASSQSASQASSSYAPPSATPARATWSPPSEPTFKASSMEGYRAPTGSAPASSYTPPPAPAPRPPSNGTPSVASTVAPTATVLRDGSIQPATYLLRGYVGGILPPQGLEAFTKEVRATSTDVWNLYSHWIRFQTEDVFRFGRELLDVVTDGASSAHSPAAVPSRRIKVTVANGNGNGHSHAEPAADTSGDASQA